MEEIHIENAKRRKENDSFIAAVCGFESKIMVVANGRKFNARS